MSAFIRSLSPAEIGLFAVLLTAVATVLVAAGMALVEHAAMRLRVARPWAVLLLVAVLLTTTTGSHA